MPWRASQAPYAVLVSEVMLQQTQVATVAPYYERFMARFPTVQTLAEADIQEVLAHWAGLGYYSRARNLHAAAKRIVEEFSGRFPDTEQGLRSLPGVGAYTAGAVLSIAFQVPVPAVDGNVERVICRLWEVEGPPKRPPARDRIRDIAAALAQCERPGDTNQALMELGATVCAAAAPHCADCCVARFCLARKQGRQEELPQTPPRKRAVQRANAAALVRDEEGRFLIARRPQNAVWGGLWEFPQAEDVGEDGPKALREHVRERLGLEVVPRGPVLKLRHGVMDRAITLWVYDCGPVVGTPDPIGYEDARWVSPGDLTVYPASSPHRRIAELLADSETRLGL